MSQLVDTERLLTTSKAISEAIAQEMERDSSVFVMGEDVGVYGGIFGSTTGLHERFGSERVMDTPISETAFIGAAVGAAATGLRPVAELMFCGFIGSCMDSMLNQGSKLRYMFGGKANVPVTIRTMVGGGFRAAAQHAQTLYPMFANIPGLKVIAPSNAADAKGLLAAAIRDDDPVIFCEHIALYAVSGPVPTGEYVLPLGKAAITRSGKDITIVGMSNTANHALAAAEILAKEGIDAEVLDLRTISPLDEDAILTSVGKTGRLVVADEANPICSMASHIAGLVASRGFHSLKAPHSPVPFSPVLEDAYLPSADKIVAQVRAILG